MNLLYTYQQNQIETTISTQLTRPLINYSRVRFLGLNFIW